ncbi:hypothetical protein OG897_06170 [Streptomyces sp. NBC_00237]|uniref:hypothetical protein n=1 Tax=Streptomyces sp. NBC_00237 TaxID=2975687 RepID=UPI0022589F9B|nr:hypothetical protein [Streptomyces sp. NBC_00237]MCX5201047.1 hypothetical protein [Streptomyces sp. NBC_00237]
MPYDLGAVVPLGTTVRDAAGALANAGSMAVTIALPDGTSSTISPVGPVSTGTYAYDYPTVQAGRHTVRWIATGVCAGAYTDSFDVREAMPPGILSLADAKKHLNKTRPSDDDEIRSWVESITAGIESLCGPVIVRTVVERHDVRRARTLALRTTPVLTLTAVDPLLSSGAVTDVVDLDIDPDTGVVRRLDGGALSGPVKVTYTAGRRVIPAALTSAARIILQHLWRTQQGPGRPQAGGDDYSVSEPIAGFGYAIPNRALQLMEPYRLPPGVG